ncbi:MAG: hypothetical protein J6A01_09020 [Proteobacteria bacterium]|nr:hypothetical protein [Pseudomonadota bacterium]
MKTEISLRLNSYLNSTINYGIGEKKGEKRRMPAGIAALPVRIGRQADSIRRRMRIDVRQ